MNYGEISKSTISYLYQSRDSLEQSPLDKNLRILIELRVSQINGCAFCCEMHVKEARREGISEDKLATLVAWKNSKYFSDLEKSALLWCDDVTSSNATNSENIAHLSRHFSEREIVDITICAALMGALNRISIGLK